MSRPVRLAVAAGFLVVVIVAFVIAKPGGDDNKKSSTVAGDDDDNQAGHTGDPYRRRQEREARGRDHEAVLQGR